MEIDKYRLRDIWCQYRRAALPFYISKTPAETEGGPCNLRRSTRHLVTVGLGAPYDEAARRLGRQAVEAGWFDTIHIIDGRDDGLDSGTILREFEHLKAQHPKGAGLWAWKPALLRRAMEIAPEGAHVYYIDAGCELSPLGGARFAQLDSLLAQQSTLFFSLPLLEDNWTKPALLNRFPHARGRVQIQATWFALKNDEIGCAIARRWDDLCREDDFKWLKEPSSEIFQPDRDHRHDQSVLSCLLKSEFPCVAPTPWEDFFAPWMYHRDSEVLLAPVHALRTRNGSSQLDHIVRTSSLVNCRIAALGRTPKPRYILDRLRMRFLHCVRDEFVILMDIVKRARLRRIQRNALDELGAP